MSSHPQPGPAEDAAAPQGWLRRRVHRVLDWLEVSGSSPEMEFDPSAFESVEAQLWGRSPERRWYMTRRPKVFAGAVTGGALLLAAALAGQPPRTDREQWWAVLLAVAAVASLAYSTLPYWAARLAFNERRRKMAAYSASHLLREIRGMDHVPLPLLFAYNRRQLDAYQEESRNQQRGAFRYAVLASAVGFVVLTIGIAASFRVAPGTEAYVAAGLSGVGAALSAYIAGTMLRISRRADDQLNRFYMEPHMMGRILLAERLLSQAADESVRDAERDAIVNQVLAWPLPGARGDGESGTTA